MQHEPKASDVIILVEKTFFRTSIVRNFISRGVKMRIFAREACVKPHLRTRSDIKDYIILNRDVNEIYLIQSHFVLGVVVAARTVETYNDQIVNSIITIVA